MYLTSLFKYKLEDFDKRYHTRIDYELKLIKYFKFEKIFKQVYDIVQLIPDIPFFIRGSAASSLVCYMLGISHIDPIKENISLTRFMNYKRISHPDIDLDFPSNMRDKVYLRIVKKWGNRVARMSTAIRYREKSAIREAIRRLGYRKQISRNEDLLSGDYGNKDEIMNIANSLIGTIKATSLHCGGIIIFDNPIDKKIIFIPRDGPRYIQQIIYEKDEIEDKGLIKIDILSNGGLAQLIAIDPSRNVYNYPEIDDKTLDIFKCGDVLGISLAGSPYLKRIFLTMKPNSRKDLAICLALTRPAAAYRQESFMEDYKKGIKYDKDGIRYLVYDDDCIDYICELIDCDVGTADQYRKAFTKQKPEIMEEFRLKLIDMECDIDKIEKIIKSLNEMRKYGFCKSHACSYSYLIFALAYQKAHNRKLFWLATLNFANSSYRKWVFYHEARLSGLNLTMDSRNREKYPWKIYNNTLVKDGYGKVKSKIKVFLSVKDKYYKQKLAIEQFRAYGYWSSDEFMPGCNIKCVKDNYYEFTGMILTHRVCEEVTYATISCKNNHYLDLIILEQVNLDLYDIIMGRGRYSTYKNMMNVINIAYVTL